MNLIAPAYAETTAATAAPPVMPAPSGADVFMQFVPLFLILIVFYFLLLRPQQKKYKEHRNMLDNLKRGDKIVTAGGVVGTITKLDGAEHVFIEIADGVQVKIVRTYIQECLTKPEPAANANEPSKKSH